MTTDTHNKTANENDISSRSCVFVQNVMQIGMSATSYDQNDIFNMASIRHLGFENLTFCKSFLIAVIYSDSASKMLSKPEAPIFNWDIGITIFISTAPSAMLDLWLRHNTVSGNRLKLSRHWVISSSWLGFVVSEILEIVFQRFGLILPDHAHIWFTHAMVDMTLIRPLNESQGYSFWYQWWLISILNY